MVKRTQAEKRAYRRATVGYLRGEIDRLRAALDKARRGCARGQRTTQWCQEAVDAHRERDTAIAAQKRAEDTMRAFKGLRDYLLERNEPHPEEFEAALFSDAWEAIRCDD